MQISVVNMFVSSPPPDLNLNVPWAEHIKPHVIPENILEISGGPTVIGEANAPGAVPVERGGDRGAELDHLSQRKAA